MDLTGIQIFKFIPAAKKESNTNCKQCGFPTCMAYAMKLAKGEANVEACPFISEELKKTFAQETKKPQILIEFGKENKIKIGDENVMFRHDKTFVNPSPFVIQIFSNDKNFDEACFLLAEAYRFTKKVEKSLSLYEILTNKERSNFFIKAFINSIHNIKLKSPFKYTFFRLICLLLCQ